MENFETRGLVKKLIFFADNMVKLIEQDGYWFIKRIELRTEGKYEEAARIEDEYLKPLDRKIKAFAERMLLEL